MPQGFEVCRVSAVRLMSSQVRNVTLAAKSLAGFAFEPGADVAIRLPRGDGGTDERHYSVWKSTVEGKFDLCVVLHGLGPGSRWAARCVVGAATMLGFWIQTRSRAAHRVEVRMPSVGALLLGEDPNAVPILRQRLG
jgi:NADPH-dependent ferric siderophore reductase